MDNERIFTEIYDKGFWGKGDSESPLSGEGSLPDNATPYVKFVRKVIEDYGVKSVVDFGHGDWRMWRDYKFEDVHYVGIDVAKGLSERVNKTHPGKKRHFFHSSKFAENLPNADLLISKEVLQHLSNIDAAREIERFTRFDRIIVANCFYSRWRLFERFKYALQLRLRVKALFEGRNPFYAAEKLENNKDIASGGFRGIDLEEEPFRAQFNDFRLVKKFDYRGRPGTSIRIKTYFFSRKT
jgi:phage anti-repressor protein